MQVESQLSDKADNYLNEVIQHNGNSVLLWSFLSSYNCGSFCIIRFDNILGLLTRKEKVKGKNEKVKAVAHYSIIRVIKKIFFCLNVRASTVTAKKFCVCSSHLSPCLHKTSDTNINIMQMEKRVEYLDGCETNSGIP